MSGLPITGIVQVNMNVIPSSDVGNVGANIGLIFGDSAHISAETRVKSYLGLSEMLDDDFLTDDPEYLAAQAYFAQKPAPKKVYIGRHDTSGAETVLQAFADICEKVYDFYGVYYCGASDADITQLVGAVETDGKGMVFFETSNTDSLVALPAAPDIFKALVTLESERAIGIYSQSAYAGAALLGAAMGRETGRENSAFSLSYATLYGVEPEEITSSELEILMAKNGNVYALRGQRYELLHMGTCINGVPYDDVMYLDMTKAVIENKVMEVMTQYGKIPQTDAGMAVILSAVSGGCEYMRNIGYISEGVWTGITIGELDEGDVLAGGYLVYAPPFSTLSQADRELRKAPPVTVALKTSGTIESVVINVNVNL